MAKKLSKHTLYLLCFAFLITSELLIAQSNSGVKTSLITLLQKLELQFDVKFSYADNDLRKLNITTTDTLVLEDVLTEIETHTPLKVTRLSKRYYTLTMPPMIKVCGIILDNFKRNSLRDATIRILGSETLIGTDSTGRFSLSNVPRDAKLEIKHTGYKSLFVEATTLANDTPCALLLLAKYYKQLDEVTVYEFLTKGLVKDRDGNFKLSSEQFGILPGLIQPDVLQTIQALPGVESIDETVSNINIRGGTNDQNLVLWNNIKMYQSGHFFGLISAFNPYLTEKVVLTKNGSPAAYGDGVSGIIAIETKDSITAQGFGGASIDLIGGNFYAQLPISETVAIQVSARRSLTDVLNTPTYQKFFNRVFDDSEVNRDGNFYFYDFTGKLLYNISKQQKLRFSFISVSNLLDYSEVDINTGQRTRSDLDQTNLSFSSHFSSKWNKTFSSDVDVYRTRYELNARNTLSNANQTLFQKNQVNETGVKLVTTKKLSSVFNWQNGYQFSQTDITNETDVTAPPVQSNVRDVLKSHALFSELSYTSPDDKVFVRAGLRMNHFENPASFKKILIEPRLSINYILTNALNLQALGEFKSQGINQIIDLEQNFLGIEKRRWIVSDGDALPLTQSKQGSLRP